MADSPIFPLDRSPFCAKGEDRALIFAISGLVAEMTQSQVHRIFLSLCLFDVFDSALES